MTNQDIARKLRSHANELAQAGDNLYRVRAFRQAAIAVMGMLEEVSVLLNTNPIALEDVPGIGPSLAETVAFYAATGIWAPNSNSPTSSDAPNKYRLLQRVMS